MNAQRAWTLTAFLVASPSVAAPFSMEVRESLGDARYTLSGNLPSGWTASAVFRELGGKTDVDVSVASPNLVFDIAGPRKVLRQDKPGAVRASIYETGADNPSFSDRFHLGVLVTSKTVPGKALFCKASSNDRKVIDEVIAICKSLTLKK